MSNVSRISETDLRLFKNTANRAKVDFSKNPDFRKTESALDIIPETVVPDEGQAQSHVTTKTTKTQADRKQLLNMLENFQSNMNKEDEKTTKPEEPVANNSTEKHSKRSSRHSRHSRHSKRSPKKRHESKRRSSRRSSHHSSHRSSPPPITHQSFNHPPPANHISELERIASSQQHLPPSDPIERIRQSFRVPPTVSINEHPVGVMSSIPRTPPRHTPRSSFHSHRHTEPNSREHFMKKKLLLEIDRMRQLGANIGKNEFSMQSSLEELQFEIQSRKENDDIIRQIIRMRQFLSGLFFIIEFGNARLGPFLQLKGWSEYLCKNISQFDRILEALYYKLFFQGQSNLMFQFFLIIISSMVLFHIKNRYLGGMPVENLFSGNYQQSSQQVPSGIGNIFQLFGSFMNKPTPQNTQPAAAQPTAQPARQFTAPVRQPTARQNHQRVPRPSQPMRPSNIRRMSRPDSGQNVSVQFIDPEIRH